MFSDLLRSFSISPTNSLGSDFIGPNLATSPLHVCPDIDISLFLLLIIIKLSIFMIYCSYKKRTISILIKTISYQGFVLSQSFKQPLFLVLSAIIISSSFFSTPTLPLSLHHFWYALFFTASQSPFSLDFLFLGLIVYCFISRSAALLPSLDLPSHSCELEALFPGSHIFFLHLFHILLELSY